MFKPHDDIALSEKIFLYNFLNLGVGMQCASSSGNFEMNLNYKILALATKSFLILRG